MPVFTGILLCAGSSERMGKTDKLTLPLFGLTPLERSLNALFAAGLDRIVIAVSERAEPTARHAAADCPIPVTILHGGASRQESSLLALRDAKGADVVVIHDAARCLVSPALIRESAQAALRYGSGVAAVPVRDTLRHREQGTTIDRDGLVMMQTPQAFCYEQILAASESAAREGFLATDECMIYEHAGFKPHFITGDLMNQKLTYPEDVPFFKKALQFPRVGYGEDTHRLVEGRALILGGVQIPFSLGLMGHSDADALTHAVVDALLGAAALGDIGTHFPDSSDEYRGISSLILLERTRAKLEDAGYAVLNIDATVVAQQPRLAPYIGSMRQALARALCLPDERVGVKATTPEGVGPEGRLECITARCVASILHI
ncbi:MAG: 2-C-methyl-D-erythritol 2,4-cyclodiphosphate synthase [Bacillota bacterium]